MQWTVNGADAIIALRCQEASSAWELDRKEGWLAARLEDLD
jgi:hypothetical protein